MHHGKTSQNGAAVEDWPGSRRAALRLPDKLMITLEKIDPF
jgi:hypothetical protein